MKGVDKADGDFRSNSVDKKWEQDLTANLIYIPG